MDFVEFANNVFDVANDALDIGFLWGGFALLLAYPLYLYFSNLKKATKEKKGFSHLTQTLIAYAMVLVVSLMWFLPEIIWLVILRLFDLPLSYFNQWGQWSWWLSSWRWLLVCAVFWYFAKRLGQEFGKDRWQRSTIGLWSILLLGWLLRGWTGLFLISLPIRWVYSLTLRRLALIIVPTSNPENMEEQKNRTYAFISYTWGTQAPMTIAGKHAWAKHDARIPGDITWDFSDFPIPYLDHIVGRPGLVWTPSHQVAAISGGTTFKRVEVPGVSFPGKLERLDQIFDLRLQIRGKEIEVVSKDGIHFLARYFTAFRLDNESWPQELYDSLRPLNSVLRGADNLTNTEGSFPFSPLRIQSTLGMTSAKATADKPLVYWDQWVMSIVEDQARKVISQKDLNEMWRPVEDIKFANAMEAIAKEIKAGAETALRAHGVLLVVSRVINFRFDHTLGDNPLDDISKQQILTWGSEWERKRVKILSEAQAEADRVQMEARAFAESMLLDAISEGLEKTHEMNPKLPQFVIALRFLSAFQDYFHKYSVHGEDDEEKRKNMAELQKAFKLWQETFFPDGK